MLRAVACMVTYALCACGGNAGTRSPEEIELASSVGHAQEEAVRPVAVLPVHADEAHWGWSTRARARESERQCEHFFSCFLGLVLIYRP